MPAAVLWADMLQGNVNYQTLWGEANPQPGVPRILCTKADGHKNLGSVKSSKCQRAYLYPRERRGVERQGYASDKAPPNPGPTNTCTTLRRMDRDTTPQWPCSSQEAGFILILICPW